MNRILLYVIGLVMLGVSSGVAQDEVADIYLTRSGEITFFSSTPMEDIEAINNSVTCILKTASGELAFKLLMKSFSFERAAMQEHFNRDYVHSDEFPKATFEGTINGLDKIDLSVNGQHKVEVSGKLTIHGETNEVAHDGLLEIKDGMINLASKFMILLADYNVKVPTNFLKNISKEIEVTVQATLEPFER